MAKQLTVEDIIHKSGIDISNGKFEILKQKNFVCLTESVGGDAPKDVIRVYEYGRSKIKQPKSWVKYIAKIGHKWYPNESITEHFLTQIGKCFTLSIANSKVVYVENYIRFLSEHFHNSEQSLEHGANILSRHTNESSTDWIDELDKKRTLKTKITIVNIIDAIRNVFKDDYKEILTNFIHMLLFDALTGNNDRHYYNWGVITHIKSSHGPYFSPVYDSARGLFWNKSDKNIISLHKCLVNGDNRSVVKYVNNSAPKISIPNNSKCNHFQLIEYLYKNDYISKEHINVWTNKESLNKVINVLNNDFKHFFILERRVVIEEILNIRFNKLIQILKTQ